MGGFVFAQLKVHAMTLQLVTSYPTAGTRIGGKAERVGLCSNKYYSFRLHGQSVMFVENIPGCARGYCSYGTKC